MKILKGLLLGILGLLLFLSLSIFGIAFMLNNTILNPGFVTTQISRLDMSALAGEVLGMQTANEEFSEELRTALVNTIDKVEPLVKEELNTAVDGTYGYLLGEKESPDLKLILRNTFLSSDFVNSLLEELDLSSLAIGLLGEQLTGGVPAEIEFVVEYMDDAIAELEPAIKEELSAAVDPITDYLLGESSGFNVEISLKPVVESLREPMKEAVFEQLPPEFEKLPPDILDQYFEQLFTQFVGMVPETYELDETLIGTEIPAQITEALLEAESALEQAREYVNLFQLGYNILIGFMVLLILGIILIHHQVRGAARSLGITFLTFGAFEYAGIFIAKYFDLIPIAQLGAPSFLEEFLSQFLNDFLAPLEMLSLGLLIGGVVLIVVSFVYPKRRQPESSPVPS